ncbi:MAG: hypothetical protein HYV94_22320 [Candidatus Rokubacteria bacterium]|nr:hypothetical protein [Candidatus Rokubacteria bacterium]
MPTVRTAMISDPERTVLISSVGWVDHDTLWRFDVPTARVERLPLGSGAQYLRLHSSGADRFVVSHHFDGARFELTVRPFSDPTRVLARATVTRAESGLAGDPDAWNGVPRVYVGYLSFAPWNDFVLFVVSPSAGQVQVQRLEWYDDSYDKGYQGIVDVLEVAGERTALVSVQRSSRLIRHDLATGRQIGIVELAARGGNPQLQYRRSAEEIWASDYDTIAVIATKDWRVIRSARLQRAAPGTQQFIGDYSFDIDEARCVVARPFSGDVIEIASSTLKIKRRAKLGRQPLEVLAFPGGKVVARDWKTGDVLHGTLARCWFAG